MDRIKQGTKEDFRQNNKKIENANKELRETLNEKIEDVSKTLSQRMDKCIEEVGQQIADTKDRLEKTEETVVQSRIEVDARIDQVENNNKIGICLLYTSRCV